MSNPTGKGGFQERKHQINRKGRPRNFDMARELAQQIAHEVITGEGGQQLTNSRGDLMTRIEAILRTWSSSRNIKAQELFMHYAVGKPKDEVDITSGGQPLRDSDDTRDAILRKLDSIAAATGPAAVPGEPDGE